METLLLFAFLSGVVTIFAPCIWPILPIVLAAGISGGKKKPLGLVTGLSVSFIFFTLALASLVKTFNFDPEILRYIAVFVIGFLGVVLLVPWFGERLEALVSRLGSFGNKFTKGRGDGFGGGFITGVALGLIWTPCAGPILAAVATLAATQTVGFETVLLVTAYVIGVSIPLYILTLLGGKVLNQTRVLSPYTAIIQRIFGAIMILAAIVIFTGYDKKLQTAILDAFPGYGEALYIFENKAEQTGQLDVLRGFEEERSTSEVSVELGLKNYGPAPELTGITGWLNSEGETLENLRGRVVLIDFWTYSCINCIRTLPYVTTWYEKYKKDGFVVIGVHTPEFAFEQKKENVARALDEYNITYPVAQDNDYATWQAYENRYWPAHYLIDAEGNIRRVHFGEGEYEKMEEAILYLLQEAGKNPLENLEKIEPERKVQGTKRTPETYLGSDRGERLSSPEKVIGDQKQTFTFPEKLESGQYAFSGQWGIEKERSLVNEGGALKLSFQGEKVFLVMGNDQDFPSKVRVYFNDQLVEESQAGKDVKEGVVRIDKEKLYELLDFQGKNTSGVLRLEFEEGNTAVYAFTFA